MRRTRILVADALPIFRAAVRNVLERESDLEVMEAADLAGIERALDAGPVEIALVDAALPPSGGIAAAAFVRDRCGAEAIVWSLSPTRETVLEAITAGASGYLHKEISADGLVRAVRGAVQGEAALTRDLAALLIDAIHDLREQSVTRERASVLSTREVEVLGYVAAGLRNKQIALALAISEFTVKRHVQNILQKLEVATRREAAALYLAANPQTGTGAA